MILLINVCSLSGLHFLSKNILSIGFATLFTHSQLLNEMFILSDKTHCCNGTFAFTLLLTKEYLTKRNYVQIYRVRYTQGSVLGPILFLLYTADLLQLVRRHHLHPHAFANDRFMGFATRRMLTLFVTVCLSALTTCQIG